MPGVTRPRLSLPPGTNPTTQSQENQALITEEINVLIKNIAASSVFGTFVTPRIDTSTGMALLCAIADHSLSSYMFGLLDNGWWSTDLMLKEMGFCKLYLRAVGHGPSGFIHINDNNMWDWELGVPIHNTKPATIFRKINSPTPPRESGPDIFCYQCVAGCAQNRKGKFLGLGSVGQPVGGKTSRYEGASWTHDTAEGLRWDQNTMKFLLSGNGYTVTLQETGSMHNVFENYENFTTVEWEELFRTTIPAFTFRR